MYFTLEVIFSLTKHDENLSKISEMCESMQIWRKSLSFQPHGQDPLLLWVGKEGLAWGNPLALGPTYPKVCWGHPIPSALPQG